MTGPRPLRRFTLINDEEDKKNQDPAKPVVNQAEAAGLRKFTLADLEQPADASKASFDDLDRRTGLPPKVQMGLLGAGNDADQEAYLRGKGYEVMRHPTHGLLWFNKAAGKWSTTNKKGLDPADVPLTGNALGELAAMTLGGAAGGVLGGAGGGIGAAPGTIAGSGVGLAAFRALRKPIARALSGDDVPETRSVGGALKETGSDLLEGVGAETGARALTAVGAARPLRAMKQWARPGLVTPAAEAAARADLPVSIGNFSESGPVRGLTKFFRTMPTGGPLQQAREDLLTATGQRVDDLGERIGPRSSLGAAQQSHQDVGRRGYDRYRQQIATMDDRVGTVLQARLNGVPELANLEGVAARFERQIAASKGADAPYYQDALAEIRRVLAASNSDPANPGLPFETVKRLRATMGRLAQSEPGRATPLPAHALQEIERALDADIGQAARRVGGNVEQYWAHRNAFIARNRDNLAPVQWDDYMRAIESGEGKRVLDYVERWDRSDARRVRQVRAMTERTHPQDWDTIARERWDRMGRANEDAPYDAIRHLTNLEKMPEAVQDAWWGGTRYRGAIRELRDLRPVLEKLRVEGIRPPNPSGDPGSVSQIRSLLYPIMRSGAITGMVGGAGAAVASSRDQNPAVGAAIAIGSTGAAGYAMSRLFASPGFGRWLKTTAAMPPNATGADVARQVTRLVTLGKREKVMNFVRDYLHATELDFDKLGVKIPEEEGMARPEDEATGDTTGLGEIKRMRAELDSAKNDLVLPRFRRRR